MNKKEVKSQQKELRIILNNWSFIGFKGILPEDEYDCLRDKIISVLYKSKSTKQDVKNTIRTELVEHFGMPEVGDTEIDNQVEIIWKWWKSKYNNTSSL
jgi:hypothetical protein